MRSGCLHWSLSFGIEPHLAFSKGHGLLPQYCSNCDADASASGSVGYMPVAMCCITHLLVLLLLLSDYSNYREVTVLFFSSPLFTRRGKTMALVFLGWLLYRSYQLGYGDLRKRGNNLRASLLFFVQPRERGIVSPDPSLGAKQC